MAIPIPKTANEISRRLAGKPARPVLWWAGLGALFVALMVVTIGQWMLSPEFRPAPTGDDPMPPWMPAWLTSVECFFSGGALICFWFYLIRPWIKEGHITWDGRFVLACATIWYLDPVDNYFNFTFTYNGHFHNMGAWCNFIPGWVSPRGENFAEPYLFIGAFFMWVFFLIAAIGCWMLDKLKIWLPQLSNLAHIVLVFFIFAALDLIFEGLLTHTGVIAYVAVYSPLALWAGTPDQFPLYESTSIAAVSIGVILMRYYRDDHGHTVFEKGLHQLALSAPVKRLLSTMAMIAGVQLILIIGFFGQYEFFALKADSFAKYPSYQLMEICGKGTPYACPTAEVPMPKRGSIAVSPDDQRLSSASRRN